MARSNENMVFCSFRMYLSNPQHLKVAKSKLTFKIKMTRR